MSGDKDVGNGDKILCQFLFSGNGVLFVFFLTENHELDRSLCEDVFQEFDAISTQSVLMQDHHLLDSSLVNSLQKGLQAGSLEVETGSDVFDDFVGRELGSQGVDLSLEVARFLLVPARDSGVEDPLEVFGRGFLRLFASHVFSDAGNVVQSSLPRLLDGIDLSFVGPSPECPL